MQAFVIMFGHILAACVGYGIYLGIRKLRENATNTPQNPNVSRTHKYGNHH